MSEKKKIRYGVIGSGWIADAMIQGAKAYPDLELTAVCSRSAERARVYAAQHGAPFYFTDLEEMVKGDTVDMVYIATPNRLHMQQAVLCLQNGKHVLCEKPLTAFPKEAEQTFAIAEVNHCYMAEAIMLLFQPQREQLQQAVASIGHISLAHFDFSQLSSKYPAYVAGQTPNIFNPELETGALQDLGIYCVYPTIWLFGNPTAITAKATFMRTGADAACSAVLQYPDKQVVLTCSKIGQSASTSEIIGDRGTVTISSVSKLENILLHTPDEPPKTLWTSEEKSVLMGREITQFADWIRYQNDAAYAVHKQYALDVARCLYTIRQQAAIRFPRDVNVTSQP